MASAFSSDEERILSRTLDATVTAPSTLDLESEATAAHIRRVAARRVALQFPDGLLSCAPAAVAGLRAALDCDDSTVDIFILGDTTFDGFQVDYVSAQHLGADFIVHYGPADLEAEGPIPVRFVLGRQPIDVGQVADACAATFVSDGGDKSQTVLVVLALQYVHVAEALAAALVTACPGAMVCGANVEREAVVAPATDTGLPRAAPVAAADTGTLATSRATAPGDSDGALDAGAMLARGKLLGRTLPQPLDEAALQASDLALLYIGCEDQTVDNLCMLLPHAGVYLCTPVGDSDAVGADTADPARLSIERLQLPTAKRLMRRYYLVQRAREAEIVGVLIGTLSAARRQAMLAAVKRLIRHAGRKQYTFVMGKLNSAKLANFAEVGVYVLLGSAEHSLLDSRDFYRPVVTPYELHLALTPGAEWTGEYILDYARLLPKLANAFGDDASEGATTRADGATDEGDEEEDDEPQFSLLTGRLIARRTEASPAARPLTDGYQVARCSSSSSSMASAAADAPHASAADAAAAPQATSMVASAAGGALARRGDYAVARTGAEALARRAYKGLDPRLGEHAPALVVEGRAGIASGFVGEGRGGIAPAAAGLLHGATTDGDTAGSLHVEAAESASAAAQPLVRPTSSRGEEDGGG